MERSPKDLFNVTNLSILKSPLPKHLLSPSSTNNNATPSTGNINSSVNISPLTSHNFKSVHTTPTHSSSISRPSPLHHTTPSPFSAFVKARLPSSFVAQSNAVEFFPLEKNKLQDNPGTKQGSSEAIAEKEETGVVKDDRKENILCVNDDGKVSPVRFTPQDVGSEAKPVCMIDGPSIPACFSNNYGREDVFSGIALASDQQQHASLEANPNLTNLDQEVARVVLESNPISNKPTQSHNKMAADEYLERCSAAALAADIVTSSSQPVQEPQDDDLASIDGGNLKPESKQQEEALEETKKEPEAEEDLNVDDSLSSSSSYESLHVTDSDDDAGKAVNDDIGGALEEDIGNHEDVQSAQRDNVRGHDDSFTREKSTFISKDETIYATNPPQKSSLNECLRREEQHEPDFQARPEQQQPQEAESTQPEEPTQSNPNNPVQNQPEPNLSDQKQEQRQSATSTYDVNSLGGSNGSLVMKGGKQAVPFTEWSFGIAPNTPRVTHIPREVAPDWIVLVGRRPDATELWHSSIVTGKLSPHLIETGSGKVYCLTDGSMDSQRMAEHGFGDAFSAKFARGFPDNWQSLIIDELARIADTGTHSTPTHTQQPPATAVAVTAPTMIIPSTSSLTATG